MTDPNRSNAADLAARREQLRLRSAQLREQIAGRTRVLQPAYRAADRVRDGAAWVRNRPALWLLVGAAVVGAAVTRPRATLALGVRAFSGWQLFLRARPLVDAFLRQLR